MNVLKDKINEVIELIQVTTDSFYQQKENNAYNTLNIMLGKLMNVMDELNHINEDIDFDENQFNENLRETLKALEDKDTVLVSDLLVYEVKEQLISVVEQL